MAALAIPLITSGIGALAGLFGHKSSSTTTGSGNTSSTTQYNYTPQQQDMIDSLMNNYNQRISQGTDLSGYAATGLQNINGASNNAQSMANNIMASRGLADSPLAAFQNVSANQSRAAQSSQLENSLPLLQNQLQLQNLQGLQSLFSSTPKGSSTQGNYSGTQTTTGSTGGGAGGMLGGLGATLAGPSGTGVSNATQIANNLPSWAGGTSPGAGAGTNMQDLLAMIG